MKRVVVLGAGLTGLSTAYHLARRGVVAEVVERGERPGGACRTIEKDGFCFDLTGHLLHFQRQESHALLAELGITRTLRLHRRRAGVALAGTVTPYPIQINTFRLPAEVRRDCLLGFVEARLAEAERRGEALGAAMPQPGRVSPNPEETGGSFSDWVLSRFGAGFAEHFFFPYNRKLYRTDVDELTTEWVGRYVPRPNLADVIEGALGLYRKEVGYNATFLYPRAGGIQMLADALAARVPRLRLRSEVVEVDLQAREVKLASGERLAWDVLVATGALPSLARMTTELPHELRAAAAALRAVGVANLNLGVRGRAPRREHWLYVPEERFPFYRVGLPSNHGRVAPAGCFTLSVEASVPAGAALPGNLTEECLAGLEELGVLRDRRDILTSELLRLDPAYVIFDAARPPVVAALRDHLRAAGVILAGRWAEWKYSTMEDALVDGAAVARRVTT